MISIDDAFEHLAQTVTPLGSESVSLIDLPGRFLSETILSEVDSPPYDKSMMDGYAIRSRDLQSSDQAFEVIETIMAGAMPSLTVGQHQAAQIMTGAPLPQNADAVVMVELAKETSQDSVRMVRFELDQIAAEKHVLRRGANYQSGQEMFTSGSRIRAHDIGLLAELGISSFQVPRKPTVAVLPTGDELVPFFETPGEGQIRNSNSPMLTSLCRNQNLQATELPIATDQADVLESRIADGLEHDLLILSGGVSAGEKDLVPAILKQQGVRQVFHKVMMKPGKPVWFGVREGEKPCYVFGLPGNPVSSLVGFRLFVVAAIEGMLGGRIQPPRMVEVELEKDHSVRGNRPTLWPGKWTRDVGQLSEDSPQQVTPLVWNGSSDLSALGLADGLIYFDANQLSETLAIR